MLQVFSRGTNSIVLWINTTMLILISYETPVAFVVKSAGVAAVLDEGKATSQTSRKQIAKFFRDIGVSQKDYAEEYGQQDFDKLFEHNFALAVRGLVSRAGHTGRGF